MKQKRHCPNPKCPNHLTPCVGFYKKRGYYITRWNQQRVPRYQCLGCGKQFSTHTFLSTYRQKKPYLNEKIFGLYCSATTQRRIAVLLKVNPKTVVRKFIFLAANANREHQLHLAEKAFDVTQVQFDEMLSFEHTRLKPLSIALAVESKTRRIIDIQVAQSHYQGRLSSIALRKYGPREDLSALARGKVFANIAGQIRTSCNLVTDAKPQYRTEIAEAIPKAQLEQVKNRGNRLQRLLQARRRNVEDKMFSLNLVAARIRHDLSRMARRVWVTTKKSERLQMHLMLFIAFHNEYKVAV